MKSKAMVSLPRIIITNAKHDVFESNIQNLVTIISLKYETTKHQLSSLNHRVNHGIKVHNEI